MLGTVRLEIYDFGMFLNAVGNMGFSILHVSFSASCLIYIIITITYQLLAGLDNPTCKISSFTWISWDTFFSKWKVKSFKRAWFSELMNIPVLRLWAADILASSQPRSSTTSISILSLYWSCVAWFSSRFIAERKEVISTCPSVQSELLSGFHIRRKTHGFFCFPAQRLYNPLFW